MKRLTVIAVALFLCVSVVISSGCIVAFSTRCETNIEDIRTKIEELDERLKKTEEKLGITTTPQEEPEPAK